MLAGAVLSNDGTVSSGTNMCHIIAPLSMPSRDLHGRLQRLAVAQQRPASGLIRVALRLGIAVVGRVRGAGYLPPAQTSHG